MLGSKRIGSGMVSFFFNATITLMGLLILLNRLSQLEGDAQMIDFDSRQADSSAGDSS